MSVEPPDPDFEALLDYIQRSRGFDFTNYKRSTLLRRVNKRMGEVGVNSYEAYLDYLEVHVDEFAHLFDTILIKVTRFFRDKEAWDYLSEEVVPQIVQRAGDVAPIRVWSAGCASGEEAYTLAMVFCEAIGQARFRQQVKIYATDVVEQALAQARQGVYSSAAISDVPDEMRDRYFDRTGTHYTFLNELRRCIIFGRHDLTADAPISRLDLVACRNLLMYLNAEVQAAVVNRLHFALNPGGFLFLGRAEMLVSHSRLFLPVNMKARVFIKEPGVAQLDAIPAHGGGAVLRPTRVLRDAAYDSSPLAQLIVSVDGNLVAANDQSRAMFGIHMRDVGRPLQDLEVSYRPLELRSRIEAAYAERRIVFARNIERIFPDGHSQYLDISITPLPVGAESGFIGVAVSFTDVTRSTQLQSELKRAGEELETAYEELQSANEELETSNEELQSTVEELETTNEELQSTNEELETMNEELQATNEELETMNEELRNRTAELDQSNMFLESILVTEPFALVVINDKGRVELWNHAAEQLWGLRSEEVYDQPFFQLDFALLPAPEVEEAVQAALVGTAGEVVCDRLDRRGRQARFRISCAPLAGRTTGVVVMMRQEPLD